MISTSKLDAQHFTSRDRRETAPPPREFSRSVEYEYMKKDAESLFKKGLRIAYF